MTDFQTEDRLAAASPLYLRSDIRAIEHGNAEQDLMDRAGYAAAELAHRLVAKKHAAIAIFAGPGNNGGDALVTARYLARQGHAISVISTASPDRLPPDAANAWQAWARDGGSIHRECPSTRFDLVIDGLFGIGLSKPLEGDSAQQVDIINAMHAPVLALDVPSGLDADTGAVPGAAVKADHTLTFIGSKPGLYTNDGPDHVGQIHLAELEISPAAPPGGRLLARALFSPPLPPRRRNSHKGHFGGLAVIGGAESMVGAALLSGRAALALGTGRVYVGLQAAHAPLVDYQQPELMLSNPAALLGRNDFNAVVIGPGLGISQQAVTILQQGIRQAVPLLVDADALNLLAQDAGLRRALKARKPINIATPHPGEAARMLDTSTENIQADRIGSAIEIARAFNAITVLKGAGSVIASPDGRWFINPTGNPGMSCAGMGDILSGMIGALLAQGLEPLYATLLGTFLHGAAGDLVMEHNRGMIGLTASEVGQAARALINQWQSELS